MVIEILLTAFIVTFIAIAILGHVLVLQAAFAPAPGRVRGKADSRPSHHAPIAGTRIATQSR
jgi:hypothetical protein